MDLILKNNLNLDMDANDIASIATSIRRILVKSCPNITQNIFGILDACTNLTHINVEIGTVSGSLSVLEAYKNLGGLTDEGNQQQKPRLVGTFIATDYFTASQYNALVNAFDNGLTIDQNGYLIDFSTFAVQTLDDEEENYNPAVAIKLQSLGYGTTLTNPIVSGKGRYFLTKTEAATITNFGSNDFNGVTTLTDTNNIIDGNTHNFTTFNEFQYFTSFAFRSNVRSFSNCTNLTRITLPSTLTELTSQYLFYNDSNLQDINLDNVINLRGYSMFNGCPLLRISSLSPNLTGMLDNTFGGCSNITINTIPVGVTQITDYTFRATTSIPYLHLLPETPIIIANVARSFGNSSFGSTSYKFYVGNGSEGRDNAIKELYVAAAGWNKMTSYIDTWYNFAAPQFTYNSVAGSITIQCARPNSTIYYTLNGDTPDENSTQYNNLAFLYDGISPIKAVSIDDRGDACYSIFYPQTTAAPTISYADSTHIQIQAPLGATVYYTTDGSNPYLNGTVYSQPIEVTGAPVKIRCYATSTGKNDSPLVEETMIYWEGLAVQTLDSNKANYNPAVAIILESHDVGDILEEPVIQGSGRYVLTKSQAAAVQNIGTDYNNVYFGGITTVTDTNGIVTSDTTATYDFTSFNEFEYFTGVTSLPNCNNYISLGKGTFTRCAKLQQIKLPNTITNLGTGSFAGCPSLTEIIIPTGVTVIPEACFAYSSCEVITHNNITIFKDNSFTCSNATTTVYPTIDKFPANLTYLGKQAYTHIYKNDYTLPASCVNIDYDRGFKGNATIGQAVHWLPEMITFTGMGTGGNMLVWFFEAVAKVYVGDGSSYGHDAAIVASYKSKFPSASAAALAKFDSWYDYAAPQITWNNGSVTISCARTPDNIYYTTDGSEPSATNGTLFTSTSSAFTWNGTNRIRAVGIDSTGDACYNQLYATTTDTPVATKVDSTHISITCATAGATIYYTIDGSSPYLNGQVYDSPIVVSDQYTTVKAYAVCSGKNDSPQRIQIIVFDESVFGQNSEESVFALQSLDSTKPNYNPLPLSRLYEKGLVPSNNCVENAYGYLLKTEAANITSFPTDLFKNLVNKTHCTKKLFDPNDNIDNFILFNELKYFTGLTGLSWGCFNGCAISYIIIPDFITNISTLSLANMGSTTSIIANGLTSSASQCFDEDIRIENLIVPNMIENSAIFDIGASSVNKGTFCIKRLNVNNNRLIYFKRILVTDSIGDTATGGIGTKCYNVEEIRVLNNCTGGTASYGICPDSATTLKFVEVMREIYTGNNSSYLFNSTSGYSGIILHIGGRTDSTFTTGFVSASPANIGITESDGTTLTGAVNKIYIGTGISEQADQTLITRYRNDNAWANVETAGIALETWWSYNGVYKTYIMDDSDAISNNFVVQNYHGSAWDETCYADSYFFGLKKDGQLIFDIAVPSGHSASECHINMWDMTAATPSESDITNNVCTVETSDNVDIAIHVNIPVIKGNVSITIS